MYQGLGFILALPALWLVASGAYPRYNADVWVEAVRLRRPNGDAECEDFWRLTRC
jgi:hypothetical protein